MDLGQDIGTRAWWRSLAAVLALCMGIVALSRMASLPAIRGAAPTPAWTTDVVNLLPMVISPLRSEARTGWRAAMSPLARPLREAPEKPRITRALTLAASDTPMSLLQRAGVSRTEALAALAAVRAVADPAAGFAGGAARLTLGRRDTKQVPRPLEAAVYRAAFDRWVVISRAAGGFAARSVPIAIDDTPLRVGGAVGRGLASAARAAGAPAGPTSQLLAQMGYAVDLERDVGRADQFDMLFAREVAEPGDVRTGELLHAVLRTGKTGARTEIARFAPPGERAQYFTSDGVSVKRLLMKTPVDGARMSSGFGWRLHPILGYSRMHRGVDFAAASGTPVMAAGAGTVQFAARAGGYGNVIRLVHAGGYETAYAHLSGFARGLRAGARVEQGQVIGYVGTTGLSTGPHLHYEVYAKGQPMNPTDSRLPVGRWLDGAAKAQFLATLENYRRVKSPAAREMAALGKPTPRS